MSRRLPNVAILASVMLAVCLSRVVSGASLPHRIFIPGAAGSPLSAAPPRPVDEVVSLIIERRRAAGCANLQRDDTLAGAAQRHSEDMARNDFMSHTGSDGSSFGQRARAAGYAFFASGEIIAAGYSTPAAVVEAWMNSPGHRGIMLDCRNTDVGAAVVERAGAQYRYYWTAVFGRH